MKNQFYRKFILLFIFQILFSLFATRKLGRAQLGAGIRYGKMTVGQVLVPGSTYTLPLFPVINTGDQKSEYQMSAESWPEKNYLKPEGLWFYFQPGLFKLEPAEIKNVSIYLRIPMYAQQGRYAALIKASAVKSPNNNVFIGPSAGSKVYFEVGKAPSVLGAFQARTSRFWKTHFRLLMLIFLVIDLLLLFLILAWLINHNLEIRVRKKDKMKKEKMIN